MHIEKITKEELDIPLPIAVKDEHSYFYIISIKECIWIAPNEFIRYSKNPQIAFNSDWEIILKEEFLKIYEQTNNFLNSKI